MRKLIFTVMATMFAVAIQAQDLANAIKMIDALQYDKARNLLIELSAKEPNNSSLYYYIGETYRLSDDNISAEKKYNEGLAKKPNDALCHIGLGKLRIEDSNLVAANENFLKAITETKMKDAKVLMLVGEALTNGKVKDIDNAEKYLLKSKDLDDKNPDIYIAIGDLYFEKKDAVLPNKNYETALEKDNKYAKAYLKKSILLSRARSIEAFTEAMETAKQGIVVDPNYPPLYAQLGELYSMQKKYEPAKENYMKYLSMVENDLYAKIRYASFLYLSKDYKKTIEEITAIHQKDQSRLFLYRLLGCSYYETGDYAKGIENMDLFFAKQNNPLKIIYDDYRYYAMLMQKTGKDSLAIIWFKKALEKEPSKFEIYGDIGQAYNRMKKYNDAIINFNIKVAVKPDANSYFYIGKCYFYSTQSDTTRYDSAVAAFKNSIKIQPAFGSNYFWVAKSYTYRDVNVEFKKVSDSAKFYYEKFIEMEKDTVKHRRDFLTTYIYLAQYNYSRGMKQESIPYWQKILAIDPTEKSALNAKKILKFE